MQRELKKNAVVDGVSEQSADLDVLVIGGGFAGCYLLHNLRKNSFKTKIVEAGSGLGGVWHWNKYPGARVDSSYLVYQLSIPEVYNTWTWSEQYPGGEELRKYFNHMDKVLELSKDVYYNTTVLSAEFDRCENKWTVTCHNGRVLKASYVIASVGFAAKRYIPDWPGLETFQGEIHHSSFWDEHYSARGKRAAVIGTGATGIQIAQEWAKEADQLTLFQRTPNLAIPMRQAKLTNEQHIKDRCNYPAYFKTRQTTDGGYLYATREALMLEQSPEDREKLFQELWDMGGFRFIANNFGDLLTNSEANAHAYNFWARKQRARIHNKTIADIVAPLKAPHAFGGKRPSLEQDYYDLFNRPNVNVVDVKSNGIKEVQPAGLVMEDGKLHQFDIIALATGFDAITGGLKDIKFRGDKSNANALTLAECWDRGVWTYLGMCVNGYPNMFFTYGPQAPTAFSNGPSCVEPQVDWIVTVLVRLRNCNASRIEATEEAQKKWKEEVLHLSRMSVRHDVASWYNGANIPGKPREPLNYEGGLVRYQTKICEVLENNLEGFDITM